MIPPTKKERMDAESAAIKLLQDAGRARRAEALTARATPANRTYDQWLTLVDAQVFRITGCALADLPDVCTADWYDDGFTPLHAAKLAITAANE